MEQFKRMVLDLKHYFERSLPLILLGAALGYAFAMHIGNTQSPVKVGFATVEDMSYIIGELKDCRENSLEISYE